jgi:transcription initiation factor TFIIIB Brf1 subunit/transcription initiation factor TFIIB
MPIELLNCPNCGSAEVTEFKQGSYVCGHCESIFKHIDPTQASITVRPEFCRCGNTIRGQCGTCHNGICSGCVSDNRLDHENPLDSIGGWYTLVGARPGGYEFQVGRPEIFQRYGSWPDLSLSTSTATGVMLQCRTTALEDGEWAPVRVEPSGLARGYVSSVKVWGYLARSAAKGHVCLPCFAAAAARVRDEVSGGQACVSPFCGDAASAVCPCCGEANCGECLFASIESRDRGVRAELRRLIDLGSGEGPRVEAPAVCAACYCEYQLTAEEMRLAPLSQSRNNKKHSREVMLRQEQALEHAAAASSRWQQQLRRGCQRQNDQPFATVHYELINN